MTSEAQDSLIEDEDEYEEEFNYFLQLLQEYNKRIQTLIVWKIKLEQIQKGIDQDTKEVPGMDQKGLNSCHERAGVARQDLQKIHQDIATMSYALSAEFLFLSKRYPFFFANGNPPSGEHSDSETSALPLSPRGP